MNDQIWTAVFDCLRPDCYTKYRVNRYIVELLNSDYFYSKSIQEVTIYNTKEIERVYLMKLDKNAAEINKTIDRSAQKKHVHANQIALPFRLYINAANVNYNYSDSYNQNSYRVDTFWRELEYSDFLRYNRQYLMSETGYVNDIPNSAIHYPGIKILVVRNCICLTPEIFAWLPDLEYLDISGCKGITNFGGHVLSKLKTLVTSELLNFSQYTPNVENLICTKKLKTEADYNDILNLEKLRTLNIHYRDNVEMFANRLETMTVHYFDRDNPKELRHLKNVTLVPHLNFGFNSF
jgi:hypothetical protein